MKKIILQNEEETIAFGKKLGALLEPGDLITMEGDLGAGKTTMTKGIGVALGVTRVINSPTFNILKGYQGRYPLYHIDAYRLEGANQELGFEEYYDGDGVCVIEWARYIEEELPRERLALTFTCLDEGRELQLEAFGNRYEEILKKVTA